MSVKKNDYVKIRKPFSICNMNYEEDPRSTLAKKQAKTMALEIDKVLGGDDYFTKLAKNNRVKGKLNKVLELIKNNRPLAAQVKLEMIIEELY